MTHSFPTRRSSDLENTFRMTNNYRLRANLFQQGVKNIDHKFLSGIHRLRALTLTRHHHFLSFAQGFIQLTFTSDPPSIARREDLPSRDRKSTRLNSSH